MIREFDMLLDAGQQVEERTHPLGSYYFTHSTDCGCPEAHFTDGFVSFLVHFEEDGKGEIWVGDVDGWETTWETEAKDIDELVTIAVGKIDDMRKQHGNI